jgi:hypothetical protein
MEISSFEDLAATLRNFTTWGNRGGYDIGGALHLLGACLENIEKHAKQTELEEMAEHLDPDRIAFLKKLAGLIKA